MVDFQIKTGNESIAKFLGWFQTDDQKDTWFINSDIATYVAYSISNNYPHIDLPFHRDWYYLMMVVEKIESLDKWVVDIFENKCEIQFGDNFTIDDITFEGKTKREAVWCACVAFVQWYEKNK